MSSVLLANVLERYNVFAFIANFTLKLNSFKTEPSLECTTHENDENDKGFGFLFLFFFLPLTKSLLSFL